MAKLNSVALLRYVLPAIFELPIRRVLYVGTDTNHHECLCELIAAGHDVFVLEADTENYEHMRAFPGIKYVTHGNIQDAPGLYMQPFDIILWWHGPERLPYEYLHDMLKDLESIATMVVLCCPWGICLYDSTHRRPLSTLYPSDFNLWGYHTALIGMEDKPPSSDIVAWKGSI